MQSEREELRENVEGEFRGPNGVNEGCVSEFNLLSLSLSACYGLYLERAKPKPEISKVQHLTAGGRTGKPVNGQTGKPENGQKG